jgi:hypothetical protein
VAKKKEKGKKRMSDEKEKKNKGLPNEKLLEGRRQVFKSRNGVCSDD